MGEGVGVGVEEMSYEVLEGVRDGGWCGGGELRGVGKGEGVGVGVEEMS